MLLHFHNATCAYNQCYNLHQKTVPLLQSIFTSYSSLICSQNPPYNPHQNLIPLYPCNFSPPFFCVQPFQQSTLKIFSLPEPFCQFNQRDRESCENWHCFNLSLLSQSMYSDNSAHNHWFFITQFLKIGVLQMGQTIQSTFFHTLNLLPLHQYPTNTTTRTYIPLKTSCLIWF